MLHLSARRLQLDYSRFLSPIAQRRLPSPIRAIAPLLNVPGMISLGGGLPNPKCFPITEINIKMPSNNDNNIQIDLNQALQYSATPGLPKLNQILLNIIHQHHQDTPKSTKENLKLTVTNGSQDALAKAFEAFLAPGDTLLIESPTYSGSLCYLQAMDNLNLETVPICPQTGIDTHYLSHLLDNWEHQKPSISKPKVIYTIPTGANPSGTTIPEHKRDHLYAIAQKHNLLILEDDPYYYLQFEKDENGKQKRIKSILARDTDGRVVRFESMSKILSAGARIGFAVGPKELIERIDLHSQASTLHASGISQAIALKILETWGLDGFERHCTETAEFYASQKAKFVKALETHLGHERASWNDASAGMFSWIDLSRSGIEDTSMLIADCTEEKVLLLPGHVFYPDTNKKCSFVRASFSLSTEEDINEALTRFAKILNKYAKQ